MNKLLFLDFETFYSREYSLSAMPTPTYILDPRFECICVGVKEEQGDAYTVDGPDFPKFITKYDPHETTTVTFNALFDNSILALRYGFVPHRMLDAMGMARALRGHLLDRFSLQAVSAHLNLGSKTDTLPKVQGYRRAEIIDRHMWDEFKAYAANDTELCAKIFNTLIPEFPIVEQKVMDLVLRCAVEPKFQVDTQLLEEHLIDLRQQKLQMLWAAGVKKDDLMSTDKFKIELENLGVQVQYKASPTGRHVPAFAKTDPFMDALLNDADPRVAALAAARLGHKSTLEETRSAKLLGIANLPWATLPDGNVRLYSGGTMPVPLRYGAAHTHRLGGDWGMNMQNLPTLRGSKGTSKLRKALIPPPRHSIIVTDLAQIEARLVAWICGEEGLVQQFRDKQDPYANMAGRIFNRIINVTIDKVERFIGKTAILGLGYGCGAVKFDTMVRTMARAQGIDISHVWQDDTALKSVKTYRRVNSKIAAAWKTLDMMLITAWLGKTVKPARFGPVHIMHGRVALPNGLELKYADPRIDQETNDLIYNYGRFKHKIYGAKLLENIVQALARIIVMNAAVRIANKGYRFALQAHDELVYIVHDSELDKAKDIIHGEMVRAPSWAPDLPLSADTNVGKSYGDAK